MKKVLFQTHAINFRGVTNSIMKFAQFNEELLGNESAIAYNPNFMLSQESKETSNAPYVINLLKQRYNVIEYSSNEELNQIAGKFDMCYSQVAGHKEDLSIKSTKHGVHCVFQYNEPYGDVYAYISKWLAGVFSNDKVQFPYCPFVIDLPKPNENGGKAFRRKYGISDNQFVYGRIGGWWTFDYEPTKMAIFEIVNSNPDIVFLLASTQPFYEHPQIKYIEPFFDEQEKSNYISACDAMIHARVLGESFGLSIAEFLFHNKPVLAWEGGFDRNHAVTLGPHGLLYSEYSAKQSMLNLPYRTPMDYSSLVAEFTPEKSMKKFEEVFLS